MSRQKRDAAELLRVDSVKTVLTLSAELSAHGKLSNVNVLLDCLRERDEVPHPTA